MSRDSSHSSQRDHDSDRQTSISDFKDISFEVKKSDKLFRKSSKKNSGSGLPLSSPSDKARRPSLNVLTPIKSVRKRLSVLSSSGKSTKNEENEVDIDMNIGRRLALPDKLDIMCGLEAPGASQKKEVDDVDGISLSSA